MKVKGRRAQGVKRKEHLTVAYKENQILEKYFGETIKAECLPVVGGEERKFRKGLIRTALMKALFQSNCLRLLPRKRCGSPLVVCW